MRAGCAGGSRRSSASSAWSTRTDRLGNLIATLPGRPGPPVMLFAHMDQLGFVVRKIEPDGFLRVERLGGVPERALAAQAVLFCARRRAGPAGVIGNKSHHATSPRRSTGCCPSRSSTSTPASTVRPRRGPPASISARPRLPPQAIELAGGRIAGTSVDDRAGCAVMLEVARALRAGAPAPTVHLVFSVQEEFNLRGALTAAQALQPDIAIQLDLLLATDTPDMASRGDVGLGGGPAMSLLSFHGRGTLNGTDPASGAARTVRGGGRRGRHRAAAQRPPWAR